MSLVPLSVDTPDGLSTASVPDSLDGASLWSPGFPSADLVGAAAALLTPFGPPAAPYVRGDRTRTVAEASRVYCTPEGPRARIVVGPGMVQVARTDPARAERTSERVRRSARIAADLRAADLVLEDRLEESDAVGLVAGLVGDFDAAAESGEWSDYLAGRIQRRDAGHDPAPSRTITRWSSKSRANMVRTLAQLDYAPLFADTTRPPAMLTLTYPGQWLDVAPDAATCKRHVDTFKRRFLRHYGRPLVGIWKREFQRRGAPHYHVLIVPPVGFMAWVAAAWADIVGARSCGALDVASCVVEGRCERHRHVTSGTGIDYAEGMRSRDPKRLAVYFSKHGSFAAKDYQNDAPREWTGDLVPFADQGSVGRFWGVWGLDKATAVVEVSPVEATAAARTLRRWQRANGFVAQRRVWRTTGVDETTGELRGRWRKSGVWVGARMRSGSAGFAVVNDGPAILSTLARYLDVVREDAYDDEVAAWLADPTRLREVDGYDWPRPEVERFPVLVWAPVAAPVVDHEDGPALLW